MDLRLAPVALGCWAAALTTLHTGFKGALAFAGVALIVAAGVIRVRPAWRWIILAVLAGMACGLAATCARLSIRDSPDVAALVKTRAVLEVELVIRDDPRAAQGLWIVPATTSGARVLVLARQDNWRDLVPGQRVRATVRFGPSRGGDLTAAVLSTSSPAVAVGEPPWIQRAASTLRSGLQTACAPLPDLPGGLLPGLVVGDTSRLSPELEEQFRAAGMTHLVAVSGSNVAIVVGCVVLLARWTRLSPTWTAVIAGLAVVGFVILARPSPSVLRAAVMGGIGLLALAGGRRRAALPALGAAIVVLIVVDPELAGDAGFALSVLATGGLLLLAPPIRDALRARRVPPGVAEALAIPASAQLACAPVIAGLGSGVSLVAVPANLLAVPAVAPATICGVLAAVVSPIWPAAAEFVAWIGSWPAWWLVKVAQVGGEIPSNVLPWPGGVGGGLLLAALTVALVIGFRRRVVRRVVVVVALAGVIGAVPVRFLSPGWPPPGWLVVACDVGQGDAIVLNAGGGAAVVVDAGPDPEAVHGCLSDLGVKTMPILVLSHFHLDHIGGLAGVLSLAPEQIITTNWKEPQTGREAVNRAAASAQVPVAEALPAAMWTVGELTLRVLQTAPVTGSRSDPNNNSLALLATVRGVRILLLGDAEAEQQSLIHEANPGLGVEVLKVAHHGSAYQHPALLDSASARVALVSVGAGNDYGHPNPALLARLERQGMRVLRTDVDGDVAVSLDAGRLMVVPHGRRVF